LDSPRPHTQIRIGGFTLDPVAKVLFRDGAALPLSKKVVETLIPLAERPNEILTKQELMAAIWPDRVVDEANLTQNIAQLRRALAVNKGEAGYIETFPARGYRLELGSVPAVSRSRRPLALIALLVLLAGAVAFWVRREGAASPSWTSSPLTRLPGREVQPALSPDGKQVAFLHLEQEAAVYVGAVDGGEPYRISGDGVQASSPAWSPDGRLVAFLESSGSVSNLVVYDLAAKTRQVFCSAGATPFGEESRLLAWSPDGARFAVVTPQLGLAVVERSGCASRPLTDPRGSARLDADPRWALDGKSITFLRGYHRLKSELFSVDVSDGKLTQLTNLGRPVSSHDLGFERGELFFAAARDNAFALHAWREGKTEALALRSISPLQISSAPGSRSLAYAPLTIDRNIWRLDLENFEWRRIAASTAQDSSPRLSPDGRRLLFRSDRSETERLYLAEADGSNPRVIAPNARASVASWSPDNESLVFNDPLTLDVYTYNIASQQLTKTAINGLHPVYSRDGLSVFTGGNGKVQRWPLRGGETELLATTRALSLGLDRSGEYLYFAKEFNDGKLYRLNLASKLEETVLTDLLPACSSCWALSKRGVVYLAATPQAPDRQELRLRLPGGESKLLLPYPEALWPEGSGPFSLSPDERYLYTVRLSPPSGADLVLARQ
jgi:Tol biopolymer transport system component/DNA-binding winged helix-turn-helix (wHTH) protein